MKKLVGTALLAALVGVTGCEDFASPMGGPSEPSEPAGAELTLRMISGDAQKGITRDTLLDPLVVEVINQDGVAVEGVNVQWQIASADGGAALGSSTATDADGLATNRWRLGDTPQAQDSLVAFVEPINADPDTVFFTARVTGVPDTIVVTQGALELDNNATKAPETVIGDTVFVAPGHWADKGFKAIVLDAAGDSVRGATLTWTVTDDVDSEVGTVGDEPEGSGSETVMVVTDGAGGITVWRKALACDDCVGTWIGATLSLEEFPEVTPVTLDALIRN